MKYKLIGDVHGKIEEYHSILKNENPEGLPTIQVGDFGFQKHHDYMIKNIDISKNQILFGNHDYYPYVYEDHSLGDWGKLPELKDTFFIRGAYSIDWKYRVLGKTWFKEEQFTHEEFDQCLDAYLQAKPKILITHDCPVDVILHIHGDYRFYNSTSNFFQALFDMHKPELWIFGHHHISIDVIIKGTRFVCLAELEHKDFELI